MKNNEQAAAISPFYGSKKPPLASYIYFHNQST